MIINDEKNWVPIGIKKLENNAMDAVKCIDNVLVTAGPGAGKTELLAQKVCYLLQTNIAKTPTRVLAISFKRDSASNLKQRVNERCSEKLAMRFESLTYDSFFKDLFDRFTNSLPKDFKILGDYEIDYDILSDRNVNVFLHNALYRKYESSVIETIPQIGIEDNFLCSDSLVEMLCPKKSEDTIKKELWIYLLSQKKITHKMITCLTELIFLCNPILLKYLQLTYSFIFLDEFQDTTKLQYRLVKLFFQQSNCHLTAVGDDKQRIMGWAGALENIFTLFENDFNSKCIHLENNYRSTPELVDIQNHITKKLTKNTNIMISQIPSVSNVNHCLVFHYNNYISEARHIASLINQRICSDNVKPDEVCILVRSQTELYTESITEELLKLGIKSRIEDQLQDLRKEKIVTLMLDVLKLVGQSRSRNAYLSIVNYLSFKSTSSLNLESLNIFITNLKKIFAVKSLVDVDIEQVLCDILEFLDIDKIISLNRQYKNPRYLERILSNFYNKLLEEISQTSTLKDAIDSFEGVNTIPIMTVHKSKGLEFKTVIYIGLEDQALWSYGNNQREETCGFFVAFSRAKEQVIFTFSERRDNQRFVERNRNNISELYRVFEEKGFYPKRIR